MNFTGILVDRHLHIISFNIPFPANYGGVIDVFYKIKALSEAGVKIHLHCFAYGRKQADSLGSLCESVYYYPRKTGGIKFFSKKPYIVSSRKSAELINRLKMDEYPILFEGLHSCFYLDHPDINNRLKIVRAHNIEWQYYYHLFLSEKRILRKAFFLIESRRLKKYEKTLRDADIIMAISPNDFKYYNRKTGHSYYLPSFHQYDEVIASNGMGEYALYHGNLSVPENLKAVNFLVKKVIKDSGISLKIAGMDPTEEMIRLISKIPEVELIANPSSETMDSLIENAQVITIPTFQHTGVKLKLIHSLFHGRHCLANRDMVLNSGVEKLCHLAESAEGFKKQLQKLMITEFTREEIKIRKGVLEQQFSNKKNASFLISKIFDVQN